MGPGQFVGSTLLSSVLLQTCLASGIPSSDFMNGHELQEGKKECLLTFPLKVPEGGGASSILTISTENVISVSHCDPLTNNETVLLHGTLNHLHRHGNKTEVSLVNQNFTVQNAKKANEGLYPIRVYKDGRCLAQVNVTVLDPPPSPATTNLPNANVSVTPTVTVENNTVVVVPVIVSVVILVFLILCISLYLKQKCSKGLKERMSKYKCHVFSQSSSSEEEESDELGQDYRLSPVEKKKGSLGHPG